MHRSRVCHSVIDVSDLELGVAFWSAALGAAGEPVSEQSRQVYRKFRLPDSTVKILLQGAWVASPHLPDRHHGHPVYPRSPRAWVAL